MRTNVIGWTGSIAKAWADVAQATTLAWGWRRPAIACGSGAFGALALPPFSLVPAMIAPMTIAVWLIDGSYVGGKGRGAWAGVRAAFAAGWWMGFGYFVAGLWWLGAAFLVEADKFAWALPLGVLALPAGLALFPALGFALARLLWSPGPLRVLALAFGLGAGEWLRGLVFTGFPWNDIGMALGANLTLAQIASLIGLHGLDFIAIAIFAAPATLWRFDDGRFAVMPTVVAGLTLTAIAIFGATRLSAPTADVAPGVALRVIQPNVAQDASFSPANKDAILKRYFALSDRPTKAYPQGVRDVTHLIWPESAFPFILSRDASALAQIADFLNGGATLITGAARVDEFGESGPAYFNSIETLTKDGLSGGRYDKQHLVPFGEYVPFENILDRVGITQFIHIPGGFTPGTGRRIFDVRGLPEATPLVCYEAIFPVEIGDALSGAHRASFLLNVTDDAWFGDTPGPRQHYAQARLRSIELGLPMVRAANTGVSAVVDGLGREVAALPVGEENVLDSALPKPLPPTWQSRFGSLSAFVIALALLIACLWGRKRA
ncbi:MAG TPA: apolipoprotein N-acyltransferase [Roseiarcus sp.]|nr:apolipoprotein N-acyltransferase [Roseiarcus sp.]